MEVPDVISVNKLLKRSFGIGIRGDYKHHRALSYLEIDGRYVNSPELGTILKRNFFRGDVVIGRFEEEDGSHLILCTRGLFSIYISRAEKYARLYKERFGGEVTIEHRF